MDMAIRTCRSALEDIHAEAMNSTDAHRCEVYASNFRKNRMQGSQHFLQSLLELESGFAGIGGEQNGCWRDFFDAKQTQATENQRLRFARTRTSNDPQRPAIMQHNGPLCLIRMW